MRVLVLVLVAGCAVAGPEDEDAPAPGPLEEEITPSGSPSFTAITLSQTTETTIAQRASVTCGNRDGSSAENNWYRVFRLADANIGSGLVVNSVAFGVQEAWGSPEVTITIGTYAGEIDPAPEQLDTALINPIASTRYTIPNTFSTDTRFLTVPLRVNVPALSQMYVEISTPSYEGDLVYFYLGGNSAGESAPSYLRAPNDLCATPEPRTTAALGFPDSHLVLTVNGTYAPRL